MTKDNYVQYNLHMEVIKMMPMIIAEDTPKNRDKIEKIADLYSDYSLGFLTDDELEKELGRLQ